MTTNAAGQQQLDAVTVGIDEDAIAQLEGMVTDVGELVDASFDDADCTIIGWGFEKGGQEQKANDGSGRTFITQDRMVMKLRVDSMDGATTRQWIGLPKEHIDDTGVARRRPTNTNSALGIILASFAGLGVADNDEAAYLYRFTGWRDLTGLQFHRQYQEFTVGRSKINVHVPTAVYGFDNDIRRAVGLPEAELQQLPATPQPVA